MKLHWITAVQAAQIPLCILYTKFSLRSGEPVTPKAKTSNCFIKSENKSGPTLLPMRLGATKTLNICWQRLNVNTDISNVQFMLSTPQLSPGDGKHESVAMRAAERSRSPTAGLTFPLWLLNLINYGSEQKPREWGDRMPTTLSEPRGDCE